MFYDEYIVWILLAYECSSLEYYMHVFAFSFLVLVLHQNQPLDALLCTTLFMKKYRAGQRGAPKYQDLISRVLVGANDALRSIK